MVPYVQLSKSELLEELARVDALFAHAKSLGLRLDISRGKPSVDQLDLSAPMLSAVIDNADCWDDGIDARNYGHLSGLPSCKRLFADLLSVDPEQVIVGGSASLQLMYMLISTAFTHGLKNSVSPWSARGTLRFLCPAPGYDRHFRITEHFGIEMIPIPLNSDGPDMDAVEQWIADPSVVGMWCVPKFSNPDGIVYSDTVIRRIASMRPACTDFTLMWDNAYCIHEFSGDYIDLPDILSIAKEYGNEEMIYEFASTSKITYSGAGVSCICACESNIAYLMKMLTPQIISFDKVNQLRHARFLKSREHTIAFMRKHAEHLRPRFNMVLSHLDEQIAPLQIATYTRPCGGYFISLYTMLGTAKRTCELCKEAGLIITPAGATYPYGIDPLDSNIRIAPSYPPLEELRVASELLCICIRKSALERLLKELGE